MVTKSDIEYVSPVSGLQQSMLYKARSEPDQGHYVEQLTFNFEKFDIQAMELALNELVKRRRALRSFFIWREQEQPRLITLRNVKVKISQLATAPVKKLLSADRKLGIALDSAPMMRMGIVDLGQQRAFCIWSFHHGVVDGWSIVLLQDELFELYRAYRNNTAIPEAIQEPSSATRLPVASAHWKDALNKASPALSLTTLPRPVMQEHQFAQTEDCINEVDSDLMQAWCKSQRITFATFAQCAWSLLTAHLGGRDSSLFGSIDSGRARLQNGESAVGMFMLLKPIITSIDEFLQVGGFLQKFQQTQWQLSEEIPPEPAELARLLKRRPGEPLFDSVLIVQNYPKSKPWKDIGLLDVKGYEQADVPLLVSIASSPQVRTLLRYQTDFLDTDSAKSLLSAYHKMLQVLAETDGKCNIADILNTFSDATGKTVETQNNASAQKRCIVQFIEQLKTQPDAIALIDEQPVSFMELAALAESIRQKLLTHNVTASDIVGIHLPRSKEAIAAMLATLAVDACYMPLDPAYPKAILEFMIQDSDASLVLSHKETDFSTKTISVPTVSTSAKLAISNSLVSENMCLMYTSGSTGNPKGVFLKHQGVLNRSAWLRSQYPFKQNAICCHRTPLCFVDSLGEIFDPLCAGVPSVIINQQTLAQLNEFITQLQKHKVSRITVVPTLLQTILDLLQEAAMELPDLRLCTVSGEALSQSLTDKFYKTLPDCQLLNLYGSTEVTADALAYAVPRTPHTENSVPIGSPIDGLFATVINTSGRILPCGFIGELVIGGAGVADGYHVRDDLSAEKFIKATFHTGDMSMIDQAGLFHYRGRTDRQIKVRGQRVEAGAVEARIQQITGFKHVIVFKHNESLIAACQGALIDATALHSKLAETLPDYCLPQRYVAIENVPKLSNGKTDYAQLCKITSDTPTTASVTNRHSLYEEQLALTIANIWQELLPDVNITRDSHFFDVGGHSLLAMRMIARVERALGFAIAIPVLIDNPVLANFAAALCTNTYDTTTAELITLRHGKPHAQRNTLICIHGDAYNIVRHINEAYPIYWLSKWAIRMQLTKTPNTLPVEPIEQTAKRYAAHINRLNLQNPCILLAACGAAVLAIETAQQLSRCGREPATLILMDLPRGELAAPIHRKLQQRQQSSWLKSLYGFAFRRLGGQALKQKYDLRKIEYKIASDRPLSDIEARNYTDIKLYTALSEYRPQPYSGAVELVFSGRWHRGVSSPQDAEVPAYWQTLLPNVQNIHFSPAVQHDDLLDGDGAAFVADIVNLKHATNSN